MNQQAGLGYFICYMHALMRHQVHLILVQLPGAKPLLKLHSMHIHASYKTGEITHSAQGNQEKNKRKKKKRKATDGKVPYLDWHWQCILTADMASRSCLWLCLDSNARSVQALQLLK